MIPMRARRAFTLLELLIVIGVLVALSAIVLPYGTQLLDSQSFERTVDDTMSQAMSARAWAQREGAVVELVVTNDGTRIEVRAVDLLRQAEDGTEGAAGADGMESALRGTRKAQRLKAEMERRVADVANRAGASAGASMGESGAGGDGGFEQTIDESWASRALEFGMHAGTEAPSSEVERSEFSTAAGDERIALFLPDGSAAAVRELWIQAGARSTRISIDPLFGEVRRIDSSAKVIRTGPADRLRDGGSQSQRSAP